MSSGGGAITVALLAGGESRRMGADKALLPLAGEPLLARTARVARDTGLPVIVVGRGDAPPGWPYPEVRFVADAAPGLGPIGGLLTALETADAPILAIACDMPRLTANAVRWLTGAAMRYPADDGIAVRNGEQIEPLFALYRPSCLPRLREQISAGRRSLQALIRAGDFVLCDAPPEIAAALVNVNTPEEWAATIAAQEKTIL